VLGEISWLSGRYLYFLDDHLFGNAPFAAALFDGMRGMGRLWQAAGTVQSVLRPGLLEKAVDCGLRSLFVGFETLNRQALREQRKSQNLRPDYAAAVRRLHSLGVMVNASFVFGMDGEDPDVFERTVEWAIEQGIETATFHILTPYPGTALYRRMQAAGRLLHSDWDLYDTRHVVYRPVGIDAEQLEVVEFTLARVHGVPLKDPVAVPVFVNATVPAGALAVPATDVSLTSAVHVVDSATTMVEGEHTTVVDVVLRLTVTVLLVPVLPL